MQQQQGNAAPAAAGASNGDTSGPASAPVTAAATAATPGPAAQRAAQASAPQQRTTPAPSSGATQARPQQQAPPTAVAAAAAPAQNQNGGSGYRPLNVKDALSYLDSVKIQFNDRPQIYNNFLDIMKDFKTQNIDTPGVIDRVSSLFRGHPPLIQGFNTFLPPGYKIDCAFDAAGRDIITITTPSGVTKRDGGGGALQTGPRAPPAHQQAGQASQAAAAAPGTNTATAPAAKPGIPEHVARPVAGSHPSAAGQAASQATAQAVGGANTPQTQASSMAANQAATISKGPSPFSGGIAGINGARPGAPPAQSGPPAANNPATAARPGQIPASAQPGSGQAQILSYNRAAANAAAANRPPAEFNHAISFVNKIKTRFHTRPNTYKAFLEILQTYQKEQKSIQEVYAQVTILFQEAPDLLEEFKEFLPDHTGSAGLSGAQSSAIDQASASNAAATAQSSTQSRTGRNTSTTSLFGVNASSTSQPQLGGVPSYLHNAQRDRSKVGQVMGGGTSLDVAASRRQAGPEHPSTSQLPPPALGQEKATHDDDEWQAPGSARKRKPTAPAVPVAEKTKAKRSKYAPEDSPEDAAMPPYAANRGYVQTYPLMVPNGVPAPVQPIILPHALRPHGPKTQLQPMISSEELGLFDRIKRYIDDKATYQEFLKLLNLYTAEIIDMPTLLEKAFLFIGGNDEIFGLFREFVGEQDGFVDGEEWPIDNAPALERERFELHNLKSYGPSYRKLPYQESKGLACSGRDALCWSVLNDNWVAYATWASEGSGAHRKNAFEDALACSEQERHWYDYHLESIRRSIAVLEPIVARINLMSVEEKAAFKLKPGLGGESASFYERIIRKVYGKDQGYEAISALYDSPGTAAPIILSRMKQKDEEWHRALREWNRVWREVDAKNFYRSIDHQGLNFKTNDKKTTTSKYLVSEIETLRREQQQKRIFPSSLKANTLEPLRPRHQFEMHIGDVDVVFDVLKLIFSYLDRATTAYAAKERLAIENTLRKFVPLLFNIPEADVEATLAPAITFGEDGDNAETDAADSDADDTAGASDTGATSEASGQSTPAAGKKGKESVADLRKQLLTSAINGANGPQGITQDDATAESTDAKGDSEADKVLLDESSWISASPVPWPAGASTPPRAAVPQSPSKLKSRAVPSPRAGPIPESVKTALQDSKIPRYNCFVSQPFYCFIRLFHLLYHRLATLKSLATEIAAKEPAEDRLNPLAVELGLAVPIPNIDEPGVRRGKNFYEFALELCERYFDAEIDSATFEENLRYMWGIKAFPAFTVDKLVASMIKNAHTINNDSRCHELIDLLAKDREAERTSLRHQIAYRHTAESVIGTDENIYRLEWIPSQDVLTIQLLSPDDLTLDDPVLTADKTWAHYLETYTLGLPTEGLRSDVRGPLLDRNREANAEAAARLQGKSDLAVRLGYDNFKLSYVSQTEETFFKATPQDESDVEEANKARREAWEKWLAGNNDTAEESQSKAPDTAEVSQTVEPSAMAVDV